MCVNKACLSNFTAASFSCWSSFPTPPLHELDVTDAQHGPVHAPLPAGQRHVQGDPG